MNNSTINKAKLSIVILGLGTFIALIVLLTANPYSGACLAFAAIISFLIYSIGVLAAIWHLYRISHRSFLGWIALALNSIPFGFMLWVLFVLFSGKW